MTTKSKAAQIAKLAHQQHASEAMEFDPDPEISEGGDNGAFVQAWIWVDFTDTDLDKTQ